ILLASVHRPTLPGGPGRLLSVATKSSLPSKNTVSRSSFAATPRVCRSWLDTLTSTSDQLSSSGGNAIEVHVVFERAGAYRVMIIGRSKPDEYTGNPVDLAG